MKTRITRRRIIEDGAAIIALLLAAGCTEAQVARWVAAEQALGQEFAIIAPELAALGFDVGTAIDVGGGVRLTLPDIARTIQQATAALSAAAAVSRGQSVLVTIESYVNAIAPVIWPVVAPIVIAANPGVGLTVGLIVKALPAIEGLLNFAVDFGHTLLSAEAQRLAAAAPRPASAALILDVTPTSPAEQALAELMARASRR